MGFLKEGGAKAGGDVETVVGGIKEVIDDGEVVAGAILDLAEEFGVFGIKGGFFPNGIAKGRGRGSGGGAYGCEEGGRFVGEGCGRVEVKGQGWWVGVTGECIGGGVGFSRNVDDGEVVFGQ